MVVLVSSHFASGCRDERACSRGLIRPWSPGTLVPAILKGRLRATVSTPLSRTKTFDGSGDSLPADVIRRRGGVPSQVDTSLILGSRASHGRLFICPVEGRKRKRKMKTKTKKAGGRRDGWSGKKETFFSSRCSGVESEERVIGG